MGFRSSTNLSLRPFQLSESNGIGDTDVVTIFGMRNSGKSVLTKRLTGVFPRKIVFDRLKEWRDGDVYVTGAQEFKAFWEKGHERESFSAIVRFRHGVDADLLRSEVDEILRVVYEFELFKNQRGVASRTALVFEELQFYCDPHSCPPYLFEILHTGRHGGLAIFGNTQRPAVIHKSFISQSSHLFLGRIFEYRDVDYLRNSAFGDSAFQASTLKQGEFLYVAPGQPVKRIPPIFSD